MKQKALKISTKTLFVYKNRNQSSIGRDTTDTTSMVTTTSKTTGMFQK